MGDRRAPTPVPAGAVKPTPPPAPPAKNGPPERGTDLRQTSHPSVSVIGPGVERGRVTAGETARLAECPTCAALRQRRDMTDEAMMLEADAQIDFIADKLDVSRAAGRVALVSVMMHQRDLLEAEKLHRAAAEDSHTRAGNRVIELVKALAALQAENRQLKAIASKAFDPSNHHNALVCPYCNPERLEFEKPPMAALQAQVRQLQPRMLSLLLFLDALMDHGSSAPPHVKDQCAAGVETVRDVLALLPREPT